MSAVMKNDDFEADNRHGILVSPRENDKLKNDPSNRPKAKTTLTGKRKRTKNVCDKQTRFFVQTDFSGLKSLFNGKLTFGIGFVRSASNTKTSDELELNGSVEDLEKLLTTSEKFAPITAIQESTQINMITDDTCRENNNAIDGKIYSITYWNDENDISNNGNCSKSDDDDILNNKNEVDTNKNDENVKNDSNNENGSNNKNDSNDNNDSNNKNDRNDNDNIYEKKENSGNKEENDHNITGNFNNDENKNINQTKHNSNNSNGNTIYTDANGSTVIINEIE